MARAMLLNPIVLLITAAAGCAACRAAGVNPHLSAMLLAGGACLAAGAVAMLPMALLPAAGPAEVFQSAFLGTVLHLGLSVVLAAAVYFAAAPGIAFVWWVLAMFWITLITQSAVFVRKMRAPAATLN